MSLDRARTVYRQATAAPSVSACADRLASYISERAGMLGNPVLHLKSIETWLADWWPKRGSVRKLAVAEFVKGIANLSPVDAARPVWKTLLARGTVLATEYQLRDRVNYRIQQDARRVEAARRDAAEAAGNLLPLESPKVKQLMKQLAARLAMLRPPPSVRCETGSPVTAAKEADDGDGDSGPGDVPW